MPIHLTAVIDPRAEVHGEAAESQDFAVNELAATSFPCSRHVIKQLNTSRADLFGTGA